MMTPTSKVKSAENHLRDSTGSHRVLEQRVQKHIVSWLSLATGGTKPETDRPHEPLRDLGKTKVLAQRGQSSALASS